MELSGVIVVGLLLLGLVVVLFTLITNPRDIDQEEEASVEKEQKEQDKRRHWWHRR
jgi:Zn-dependent membrane protease YugP